MAAAGAAPDPAYAHGIPGNSSNLLDFLIQFAKVKRRNGLDTAHFFLLHAFCEKPMNLGELLEATLPPLGYELVDWEKSSGSGLVRVFIDKPDGVDVEDCARVSHHLTRLFAVENVDFDRLEVSSPGLNRPLTKPADFRRFAGEEADLRLTEPVANTRRVKGILRGCEDGAVLIETGKGVLAIPLADIGKARLVPKIEWRKAT